MKNWDPHHHLHLHFWVADSLRLESFDGGKTLPDPNSSDRYRGSAFIFQRSAKENSEGGVWEGRRESWKSTPDRDTQAAINRERDCERM